MGSHYALFSELSSYIVFFTHKDLEYLYSNLSQQLNIYLNYSVPVRQNIVLSSFTFFLLFYF